MGSGRDKRWFARLHGKDRLSFAYPLPPPIVLFVGVCALTVVRGETNDGWLMAGYGWDRHLPIP